MLIVALLMAGYAECHYDVCRYAECRGAKNDILNFQCCIVMYLLSVILTM
jgi:hypothetical protein